MATMTAFSSEVAAFEGLREEFLALTDEIVWCTVATIDHRLRPRTRIFHVAWDVRGGAPVGHVTTHRTPVITAHLADNPYVSCSYWTAKHAAVYADCRADWVGDRAGKARAWEVMAPKARRLGFDPDAAWPGGVDDPSFEVLRFTPWRIQVTLPDLAAGQTIASSRVWHSERS